MIRVGKMVEFLEEYRVFMSMLRQELLTTRRTVPQASAVASDANGSHFFVYF